MDYSLPVVQIDPGAPDAVVAEFQAMSDDWISQHYPPDTDADWDRALEDFRQRLAALDCGWIRVAGSGIRFLGEGRA